VQNHDRAVCRYTHAANGTAQPNEYLSSLRLDEPSTDGITDQTGRFMNVEFRHNPGSMGLRGFCADTQNHTNLFCSFPFGNELEYLTLSTTQRLGRHVGFGQIGLDDRF